MTNNMDAKHQLVERDELDHGYRVVGEMLEYFDGYKLATWAPLASIIMRERAELRSVLSDILPTPLCGESLNLPDSETVSIVVTFGKLKAARQALSNTSSPLGS
jgi:hypothetical protein